MTFKRLLDEPESDFAGALLRSAALDVPGSAQVRRGVLAITAAGSALASAEAVSAASSAAAGAGAAPTGFGALGVLGLAKWVSVGLAAGLVTAGTGAFVASDSADLREADEPTQPSVSAREAAPGRNANFTERDQHRRPLDSRASSNAAAEHVESGPAARSTGGIGRPTRRRDGPLQAAATETPGGRASSVSTEARPASTAVPGSVTSFPHTVPSTASAESAGVIAPPSSGYTSAVAMSAELTALARARTALAARTPAVVLAELETYRRLSRTHVLDAEAFMLRVEALVQLGRAAEAAALAEKYLAANPRSPHRVRLAQVAGLGDR